MDGFSCNEKRHVKLKQNREKGKWRKIRVKCRLDSN